MAAEPAQDVVEALPKKSFTAIPPERTNNTAPRTCGPQPQRLSRTRFERGPQLNRFSIQGRAEIRARQRYDSALWKQKCPPSSVISNRLRPQDFEPDDFPAEERSHPPPRKLKRQGTESFSPKSCTVVKRPGSCT